MGSHAVVSRPVFISNNNYHANYTVIHGDSLLPLEQWEVVEPCYRLLHGEGSPYTRGILPRGPVPWGVLGIEASPRLPGIGAGP